MDSPTEATVFVIDCKIHGRQVHLLWLSEAADSDHLLMAGSKIRCFSSEAEARNFALANFRNVSPDAPFDYDFDAIILWCADDLDANVNCEQVLNAWNLLTDIPRKPSIPSAFVDAERQQSMLYDKLFWGSNLPSMTPEGKHFEPSWSQQEVQVLKGLLASGITEFQLLLAVPTKAG